MELVSKKHQGKIQGWFMAFTSLGGIVGPYATGYLIENSSSPATGFEYAFIVCGVVLLIFGGACMGIGKTEEIGSTPYNTKFAGNCLTKYRIREMCVQSYIV